MYHQILAPVGGSLALSALVAALPLLLLLVLLGLGRMPPHWAAALALLGTFIVAVFAFRLPPLVSASGAAEGAAFGFFPIVWIIINAVWVNGLISRSGQLTTLRRTFLGLSTDYRVQALIIAFCFGSLLESMAGFGAPIAVVAAILLAIGLSPIRAATVAMFADAAGTAFGSVGNPIFALSKATGLPATQLGDMVGRQSPMVAVFVPFTLLLVLDGWRGLRQLWPIALATGLGFAVGQFVAANYLAFPLADLIGALLATAVAVLLLRVWSPPTIRTGPGSPSVRAAKPDAADEDTAEPATRLSAAAVGRAFAPYGVLIALLAVVSINGPIATFVARRSITITWPDVRVIGGNGKPLALPQFQIAWLSATGTVLLVTGVVTMAILRISVSEAVREYGRTLMRVRYPAATVMLMMALAYLLNYSGQAVTIGTFAASAGKAFALLAPVLGWLGVAATGSDTSANALFGAVAVAAARHLGLNSYLLAAANSEAGALGKLVSPQNLAMAAAAVGLAGDEGRLLRRTFLWSIGYLVGFALLVYLMAVGPLAGLVVR